MSVFISHSYVAFKLHFFAFLIYNWSYDLKKAKWKKPIKCCFNNAQRPDWIKKIKNSVYSFINTCMTFCRISYLFFKSKSQIDFRFQSFSNMNIFSSPELKSHMRWKVKLVSWSVFVWHHLSVILSVCLSVNILHFRFLQNHKAIFYQTSSMHYKVKRWRATFSVKRR